MNKETPGEQFLKIMDYYRQKDLERIVCWACNNFQRGSGYCAEHSSSGRRYRSNYFKEKSLLSKR